MALTDNLRWYWKCDSNWNDSTANWYNLTVDWATLTTWSGGKIAECYDYDGSNDRLYLANNLWIDWNSPVSMSAWIKVDWDGWSWHMVIHLSTTTGNNFFCIMYDKNTWSWGTNKLIFARNRDYIASDWSYYTITLNTSLWYHVVLTYDWTTLLWYVNGSQVTTRSSTGSGSISDSWNYFTIWRYDKNAQRFDWKIDEVWVWDKTLSTSEISELYNSWSGLQYPFTWTTVFKPKIIQF